MQGYHKSVLLREGIEALGVHDAWYLDCTLGDGGHSIEIIKRGGRIVGLDVDPQALERAKQRLGDLGFLGKAVLVQGNFRDIQNLIQQTDTKDREFNGAIFDLGVSSLQLETPSRGFSFGKVGPIDMRMDPSLQVRALDLLNTLTRKELYELFNQLGEEKYSWRLADALVLAREIGYSNTKDLAGLIENVYRRLGIRNWKIHPATKVFQALRMAVNDELGALTEGLGQVQDLIIKNGHIVVISFHSLEDRIVKHTFKQWESLGLGEIVTRKPAVPTAEEVADNPRVRSAKMRVFKKYDHHQKI